MSAADRSLPGACAPLLVRACAVWAVLSVGVCGYACVRCEDAGSGRSRRQAGEDIVSSSTPPLQLWELLRRDHWPLEPHSLMQSIRGAPEVIFSRRHALYLLPGLCVYVYVRVYVRVCDVVDVGVRWSDGSVEHHAISHLTVE
jgi:hypothetical protein